MTGNAADVTNTCYIMAFEYWWSMVISSTMLWGHEMC
jgi:hypothetical protein